MKIEKVVKKDDENVIVNLDTGEKLFLSYEIFLKNRLKKGKEISEDGFSFLIRENQKYFIKRKAFDFLSRRLHSYRELKLKLLRKKYDKTLIDEVLDYLKVKKFIDDYEFGRQYVEEKIRTKSWGRNKLKSELFRKGLHSEVIDEILNEEEFSSYKENALALAEKKLKILSKRNYDNRQLTSRLYSFLYSKGYDYDTIKEIISRLIEEDNFI
jgi:regulatory protein